MLALLSLVITNVSIIILTNNYVTTDDNISDDTIQQENLQWTIKYVNLIDLNGQYNFNIVLKASMVCMWRPLSLFCPTSWQTGVCPWEAACRDLGGSYVWFSLFWEQTKETKSLNVKRGSYDSVNSSEGSSRERKCLKCPEQIHDWFRVKSLQCSLYSL